LHKYSIISDNIKTANSDIQYAKIFILALIKHPAASSGVLTALLNLLVLNQLSPQGAGN
jgi:hypothetical protein